MQHFDKLIHMHLKLCWVNLMYFRLLVVISTTSQLELNNSNANFLSYYALHLVALVMLTGIAAVSCLHNVISRYLRELRDSEAYKAGFIGYISVPRHWNPAATSSTCGVVTWGCFTQYRPYVRGVHRSLLDSQHKVNWSLSVFLLIGCRHSWNNNSIADDLKRHVTWL